MSNEDKIVIKKQTINLSIIKSDLVEVKETGDGLVFNLQGGMHLTVIEPQMPLEVKRVIFNAVHTFKKVNLEIDLMDYKTPVKITPNK
jgi:hypothetical protein